MKLESLLTEAAGDFYQERELFALLNLGVIEGLDHGSMNATDAVQSFYNADNCLFVRKRMKGKVPDRIMSRGVQLPDLFDVLPPRRSPSGIQTRTGRDADALLAIAGKSRPGGPFDPRVFFTVAQDFSRDKSGPIRY